MKLPSVAQRWIDLIPERDGDSKEMKVLCLGLSRTGTMSIRAALAMLGYRAYHMDQIGQMDLPNELHTPCWNEAFLAKIHGNGKLYESDDFRKLLRNYDAVTDAPCVCFPDELLAAYPNAKVILSTRDVDKWLASMNTSYYHILTSNSWKFKFWRIMAVIDTDAMARIQRILMYPLEYWTNGDWQNRKKLRQGYLDHNDHIRNVVPKDNLLEFRVSDGWEPLCQFLGKPVPEKPFPHVNKGYAVTDMLFILAVIRAVTVFWQKFKWPLAVVIVGIAATTIAKAAKLTRS